MAAECINSRAKELGIERPKIRNRQAIFNQNTLIYVMINLRAFFCVVNRRRFAVGTTSGSGMLVWHAHYGTSAKAASGA